MRSLTLLAISLDLWLYLHLLKLMAVHQFRLQFIALLKFADVLSNGVWTHWPPKSRLNNVSNAFKIIQRQVWIGWFESSLNIHFSIFKNNSEFVFVLWVVTCVWKYKTNHNVSENAIIPNLKAHFGKLITLTNCFCSQFFLFVNKFFSVWKKTCWKFY